MLGCYEVSFVKEFLHADFNLHVESFFQLLICNECHIVGQQLLTKIVHQVTSGVLLGEVMHDDFRDIKIIINDSNNY